MQLLPKVQTCFFGIQIKNGALLTSLMMVVAASSVDIGKEMAPYLEPLENKQYKGELELAMKMAVSLVVMLAILYMIVDLNLKRRAFADALIAAIALMLVVRVVCTTGIAYILVKEDCEGSFKWGEVMKKLEQECADLPWIAAETVSTVVMRNIIWVYFMIVVNSWPDPELLKETE